MLRALLSRSCSLESRGAMCESYLGPERGLALADAYPDAAALLIRRTSSGADARTHASRHWSAVKLASEVMDIPGSRVL
jgi:hypothetical protein